LINKLAIRLGLIVTLIVMIVACDKDVIISKYKGFDDGYVSMRSGTSWLYKVDSTCTETNKPANLYTFYVKETVIDSVKQGSTVTYLISSERSVALDGSFEPYGEFRLIVSDERIIHTGFDYKIIALKAPLFVNSKWNNVYLECNNQQSMVVNRMDVDYLHGNAYEDVITVNHCLEYHYDIRKSHESRYAKEAGLIEETIYRGFYNRLEGRTTGTTITKSLLTYAY